MFVKKEKNGECSSAMYLVWHTFVIIRNVSYYIMFWWHFTKICNERRLAHWYSLLYQAYVWHNNKCFKRTFEWMINIIIFCGFYYTNTLYAKYKNINHSWFVEIEYIFFYVVPKFDFKYLFMHYGLLDNLKACYYPKCPLIQS